MTTSAIDSTPAVFVEENCTSIQGAENQQVMVDWLESLQEEEQEETYLGEPEE